MSGETSVVLVASCDPFYSGNRLAMIPIRLSSARVLVVFRSRNNTLVLTAAPASRHMQAMARSIATPDVRKAPERGQAVRWSPCGSIAGGCTCIWLGCKAKSLQQQDTKVCRFDGKDMQGQCCGEHCVRSCCKGAAL